MGLHKAPRVNMAVTEETLDYLKRRAAKERRPLANMASALFIEMVEKLIEQEKI
jgi:hypothetical protein